VERPGGTGFSPRDLTVEAVAPLFDRPVEGFGELFRLLSYQQVGAAAMLSRTAAGLVRDRAVFLLPGSPKAVSLALEALISCRKRPTGPSSLSASESAASSVSSSTSSSSPIKFSLQRQSPYSTKGAQ
jgi:molybdopterin biosynthesis enzyme MoaB